MTLPLAVAAAGVVMLLAVVVIVAAARRLPRGDHRRSCAGSRPASTRSSARCGEIVAKTGPVNEVVGTINQHLDAGVELLEGMLVKKAGIEDAVGLVDGLYPGAAAAGFRGIEGQRRRPARRASARSTRAARSRSPASAARRRSPWATRTARCRATSPRAARRRARCIPTGARSIAKTLPGSPVIGADAPVQYEPGDDEERPCRYLRRSSTSARRASRTRSRCWSGSGPRPGSSPAATRCCR